MSLEKHELDFWLFPELFARILTFIAVTYVLSGYWQGKSFGNIILPLLLIVFLLWTFKPLIIAIKDFKLPPKKKEIKKVETKQIFYFIFWLVTLIGFILFINRVFVQILPASEWRVLTDHLVGGFLVTIWFYIILLGMFSFFQPHRIIDYKKRWFVLASGVTIIGMLFWEGYVQGFRDASQIVADLFGLTLSWAYFMFFRKFNKPKNTQIQSDNKGKSKK